MKKACFLSFAAMTLMLIGGGCASSVSIGTWQKGVEQYVRQKGGGDPSVLRDMTFKGDRRGFAVFSANRPKHSTDVTGVLLGNVHVAERPWIVYAVGLVDEQQVEDVRVAALTVQSNRYTWRVSGADGAALKAYREYNHGLARRRFPNRRDEPADYTGFPRDEDRFDMTTQGTTIGVTHPTSGARWHLDVAARRKK